MTIFFETLGINKSLLASVSILRKNLNKKPQFNNLEYKSEKTFKKILSQLSENYIVLYCFRLCQLLS